jgi:pyruvate dehydrogenase kinase 2/3/4
VRWRGRTACQAATRPAEPLHARAPAACRLPAELKRELADTIGLNDLPDIHQFLDGFYMSRIGIRMLIGQHIALKEPQRENHIGLIDTKCSPGVVCSDAISDARSICQREKGSAPEVEVYGDPDFTFPYVPSHLHHMVSEAGRHTEQNQGGFPGSGAAGLGK